MVVAKNFVDGWFLFRGRGQSYLIYHYLFRRGWPYVVSPTYDIAIVH